MRGRLGLSTDLARLDRLLPLLPLLRSAERRLLNTRDSSTCRRTKVEKATVEQTISATSISTGLAMASASFFHHAYIETGSDRAVTYLSGDH